MVKKRKKSLTRAERMRARWRAPAYRARKTGWQHSEESKRKTSQSLMGHGFTEETREKIAATLRRHGLPDSLVVPEGMKYCRKCKRVLPYDAFQKSSSTRDGCQSACRECRLAAEKAKSYPRRTTGTKMCTRCNRELPVSEYHGNKRAKDGLCSICKDCNRSHSTAWNQENAEYKREYQARWQRDNAVSVNAKNHRRRARIQNAPGDGWTPEQWQAILAHYAPDGLCLRCKKKRKLTADHIVMLQDGGRNEVANLQPLCRKCNSKKESVDYRPDGGAFALSLMNGKDAS